MNPLRVAVVGAGGIAQRNAAEAAASGVCSIAGVFDVVKAAAGRRIVAEHLLLRLQVGSGDAPRAFGFGFRRRRGDHARRGR